MSLSEVFHVVRTVRKASTIGKEAGRAAEGGGASISALAPFEALRMTQLVGRATLLGGPGLGAAAVGGLAVLGILGYFSQFIQPGGQLLLPDPTSGISYADQARQALMVRIYGPQKGNEIWQNEFAGRSIEVDLRTKYP
jgi:hypothetical protein